MLADGRDGLMSNKWWLTVFPGLAIVLVVCAANILGDWLRRHLDPNLKGL
jgi:peptide/nickel transport system permease protein